MRSVSFKGHATKTGKTGAWQTDECLYEKGNIYIYIYIYVYIYIHVRDFSMPGHAVLISHNALLVVESLTRKSS
jgi:hypothetical protein